MNKLYYGDCLTVMQDIPLKSIDLIYLDPPFNSNQDYNNIYKDETGRPLPDQIEAFTDTWTLDATKELSIRQMPVMMREAGIDDDVAQFWQIWMNALRKTQPRLLAYLAYMTERLIWMRTKLKPSGSLFFHCDEAASHYIKIILDGIMGHNNFRNEIVWQRAAGRAKGSQHAPKTLGTDTDSIFYYARSELHRMSGIYGILSEAETLEKFPHEDQRGRYNTTTPIFRQPSMGPRPNLCYEYNGVRNPHPSGWRVNREKLAEMDARDEIIWREGKRPLRKSYLANYKGKPIGSLWIDIPNASGKERMGYATQKPKLLMERIIEMACPPDGMVLDTFCGCATTLEAAQRLGRRWIGIDIAIHAIKRVAKIRLEERLSLVEGRDFVVDGVPRNFEGAKDLWERDKYHFQRWAAESVDGFVTNKRTADGGIDGRIFFDAGLPELQSMVLEIKGGKNVGIRDLRALGNVLENDEAMLAGLIVLEPLGKTKQRNFDRHMANAGHVDINGVAYPRMQMLTVDEIFDGKRFNTPVVRGKSESRQSQMHMTPRKAQGEQLSLDMND